MYIPILARPPVSSARRPVQVGARLAAGVVERRAVGTQLVVERVDVTVALLADVAGARAQQRPRRVAPLPFAERQRAPVGLVVDPARRGGRRGRGHRRVGGAGRPSRRAARRRSLTVLKMAGGGAAHRDRVGMLDVELVELGQHAQADLEVGRVDRGRGLAHRSDCTQAR